MIHSLRTFAASSLSALIILSIAQASPAATTVNGQVSAVTLYRGQAQVTRSIPLPAEVGSLELVVGNLPQQILPDSLFAEGSDAVEIRAVRYRTRAVSEEPREEVRQIDEAIHKLRLELERAKKQAGVLKRQLQYLGKLEGFVAPTAHADLAHGTLDADALEQMTIFAFEQHERIAKAEVSLQVQIRGLNEQIELAARKRAEITRDASKTIREAVLFLVKHQAGPGELRLNYQVGHCGWSPTYTIRAGGDRQTAQLEYSALIHQLSGEDWNDVQVMLSTASPTLSAASPGLAPFHVSLLADSPDDPFGGGGGYGEGGGELGGRKSHFGRGFSSGEVADQLQQLARQQTRLNVSANNAFAFDERANIAWSLHEYACSVQQLEINGDDTTLGVLRSVDRQETDGPSLSYQLAGSVTLASRSDQQLVRIARTDMPSHFYHVAIPVLNSYVFREAELTNTGGADLLGGPVTVYLDGRFVGRTEIPSVARGQAFVVGFGANPQLRARRELVHREDDLQGGNRETRFEYRLVVENYASDATPIRIVDRLPLAKTGADIRVTLGDSSDPLSTDSLYERQERPLGILRWDVEVAAGSAGETARLIEYEYTVEYDRKYVVSAVSTEATLQNEFRRLERNRQKR